jgi:hypothetical protein
MTGQVLCARCQKPITPGQEQEVPEEQGTAANLVFIHRTACAIPHVRRSNG